MNESDIDQIKRHLAGMRIETKGCEVTISMTCEDEEEAAMMAEVMRLGMRGQLLAIDMAELHEPQ